MHVHLSWKAPRLNFSWSLFSKQLCLFSSNAAAKDFLVFHWITSKVESFVPQGLKPFPGISLKTNVDTYQCSAIPKRWEYISFLRGLVFKMGDFFAGLSSHKLLSTIIPKSKFCGLGYCALFLKALGLILLNCFPSKRSLVAQGDYMSLFLSVYNPLLSANRLFLLSVWQFGNGKVRQIKGS